MTKENGIEIKITEMENGLWFGRVPNLLDGSLDEIECQRDTPHKCLDSLIEQLKEGKHLL